MCNFFSGIVKRDFTVLTLGNTSSHEEIVKANKLDDKLAVDDERRDWVRFELNPKDVLSVRREEWSFKVDEQSKPSWFHKTHEDACWDYLNKNIINARWMAAARKEIAFVKGIKWFKPMREPDLKSLDKIAQECGRTFKIPGKIRIKLIQLPAWSAAESAAWSAAWSAARSAAESAARSAAWSAAESAAESAARSAARSAAWSAARSAAESAAWSAAESAARSAAWSAARSAAESAAWSAARSAAESAARSAARSAAWSAARSAEFECSADVNKKYNINPFKIYVRLWARGFYCCGIHNKTLTLGYIQKKEAKP